MKNRNLQIMISISPVVEVGNNNLLIKSIRQERDAETVKHEKLNDEKAVIIWVRGK